MTLIFDSIVKSENSLPESSKISHGFSLVPHQSLSWQGVNRSAIPAGTERDPSNQRKAECDNELSCFAVK
jgi:hypothetical protein